MALTPAQARLVDDQAHAARGILPAQAAQTVLKTYPVAWRNCWDGRAQEPTFKTRSRSVLSVDIPQGRDLHVSRVHRRWGVVSIPKIGRVGFRWTKDLPVGKRANQQSSLLRLERRAAHRRTSRKHGEKTSGRLQRTYDRIQGLRARAKRRHLDWQHETTTDIARKYSTVVVEALTIPNMVKSAKGTVDRPGRNVAQKSGLSRSIHAEAWGRTIRLLTYRTALAGGSLHEVPAPGTSQRCSACGHITPGSRESQAVFVCKNPDCGWTGNADHNAGRNVLHLYRMGLALVPAAGRAVVRRARRVKPAAVR
ncbi:RNA-guided endonuclease InsQ/TnpB family protein [Streptomyces sp. NPDC057027]|uniref:RNA-guided endonuclease InsQ/TnpB family protein n=1 Tax=Streptomyces sp. NPDC057027 TaxID=3346004 RepID=UPI00363904F6